MKYPRLAILVVFLLALVIWFFQRSAPEARTATHPIKSVITISAAKPVTAQVAQPVIAPVNPAAASTPTAADLPANFDPRAEEAKIELRSNLNFLIQSQLEITSFYPDGLGEAYGLSMEELIEAKSFLDVAPTLNETGNVATYSTTDETWATMREPLVAAGADTWLSYFDQGRLSRNMLFVKVNDKWYSADQRGVPLMDDKGNQYPHDNPSGTKDDPFANNNPFNKN